MLNFKLTTHLHLVTCQRLREALFPWLFRVFVLWCLVSLFTSSGCCTKMWVR